MRNFTAAILHLRKPAFLSLAVVFILGVTPSQAQEPPAPQGRRISPQPVRQQEDRSTPPLPVFEFHSGFWLNLHHVLYQQARIRQQRPTRRPAAAAAELLPTANLSPEEQRAWEDSLNEYANTMAARDLLFDGDMVLIKNRLAEMENCADLSGRTQERCVSGLRPELIATLERAAPVYRAKWWPEHDRRNREWINSLAPRVQQSGVALARQLSSLFHTDWPSNHIRVDVSAYAGPLGSYTSVDPLAVTISSADERTQGPFALEVVFYEASHILGLGAREVIARECRARDKPIPRELWDALLYYTTVLFSRGPVSRPGAEPGQAVADRGWRNFRNVLDGYWKPYLQNALRNQTNPEDLERVISRIIASL